MIGSAGEPLVQRVDEGEILLREPHDFTWLSAFGRVFVVLQGSVSGCLGFGVRRGGQTFYLRHAGALPYGYFGNPAQAMQDMQAAEAIYAQISHPALNPLLEVYALPTGRVQVFPWLDGFPLSPPPENYARFRRLPLIHRLAWYDQLVDLMANCEREAIIPLGMSDSHIIVDEVKNTVTLSTIHRFRQLPCESMPGRTPGTPWYRAPECRTLGAALDETTAVFSAGALAYTFLGDRIDHTDTMWEGSSEMLRTARSAIDPKRDVRPPTVRAYQQQWRRAVAAFRLPEYPIQP